MDEVNSQQVIVSSVIRELQNRLDSSVANALLEVNRGPD